MIKEIPEHDFDCDFNNKGFFSIGCMACTYSFIKTSKESLVAEYRDSHSILNETERKQYEEKITFFTTLEAQL